MKQLYYQSPNIVNQQITSTLSTINSDLGCLQNFCTKLWKLLVFFFYLTKHREGVIQKLNTLYTIKNASHSRFKIFIIINTTFLFQHQFLYTYLRLSKSFMQILWFTLYRLYYWYLIELLRSITNVVYWNV